MNMDDDRNIVYQVISTVFRLPIAGFEFGECLLYGFHNFEIFATICWMCFEVDGYFKLT